MSPLSGTQPVPAARRGLAAAAAVAVGAWVSLEHAAAAVARGRPDVAGSGLPCVAPTAVAAVAALCATAHDCAAEAPHRHQPAVPVGAGSRVAWRRSVRVWPAQGGCALLLWLALPCTSAATVCAASSATCAPMPSCLAGIWTCPARCRPWARETVSVATANLQRSLSHRWLPDWTARGQPDECFERAKSGALQTPAGMQAHASDRQPAREADGEPASRRPKAGASTQTYSPGDRCDGRCSQCQPQPATQA